MANGTTPLMHAIDSESDSACQCDVAPEDMSLELTQLLLSSGAAVTPGAYRWAEKSYGSRRILALLEEFGSRV
jgi:hypothetical protein